MCSVMANTIPTLNKQERARDWRAVIQPAHVIGQQ